jgi:tRNA 2-thiouridine synthesizing protein A
MTAQSPKITTSLDLKGLKCPLPVLKARRAIKEMTPGQVLEVIADDPAAQLDFPHFCETTGHELLSLTSKGEGVDLTIIVMIKTVG